MKAAAPVLHGSMHRLHQHRRDQHAPLKLLVHRKTADANRSQGRRSRQASGLFGPKFGEPNEAIRDAAADVLLDLRLEIPVEGFFAAMKRVATMRHVLVL